MKVRNQKCIRNLSFKSLMASRKRNVIAIIAIVLTTLLFTSLFTIVMSINSSYETYTFRQIGGYNHGTFKEVSEVQAEAIANHKKVKAVGKRKVIGMAYEGVFAKVSAEISYMDENCSKWSYAEPTTGRMPESYNEISMDTGALKLLGANPELGAEITVTYIVGTGADTQKYYEKTDTFTLVGYWEYDDISPVHYLNISEEYVKAIENEALSIGMDAFRTDLNVMMASSIDIRGQMEQVDRDLGYSWERNSSDEVVRIGVNWGYTTAQLGESLDAGTILAIVAFLMLVILTGYLVIYNIFQISVTGDIRFYGLLKTIGVTPRQLRRIIRFQAVFLCLIGIPIGILLGYCIGAVLLPIIMENLTLGGVSATLSTSPFIFVASALFALVTVLLSCARPGKIAAKVSPVEATKYTETIQSNRKSRSTRGAKVYHMAFANIGRNRMKTTLVVVSLSLAVVLLNIFVTFVNGFDMEKYLAKSSCADFIVSDNEYFRYGQGVQEYISEEIISEIENNTSQTLAGCGYSLVGARPQEWMSEEQWKTSIEKYYPSEVVETVFSAKARRGDLVSEDVLMEGLDETLFDKINVVEGDISSLFSEDSNAIAIVMYVDDYGKIINHDYPKLGEQYTITYIDEDYYIDSRTGKLCDENTPEEYMKYCVADSHDVEYTVCAYVTVPYAMGHRYGIMGNNALLTVDKLRKDSKQTVIPMFYLFDTPDVLSEVAAEEYLAKLTDGAESKLMYESKASIRAEFAGFKNMFTVLGGVLCMIIGIVGVLNFFNAIMTGILARRREFAVLQSVGMTNRQLKKMLIFEGLFYALGSAMLALILSVVITPIAGNMFEKIFWFFSAKYTVIPILVVIPVFVILGWLVPSLVYGQTMKYSVVERLREVE